MQDDDTREGDADRTQDHVSSITGDVYLTLTARIRLLFTGRLTFIAYQDPITGVHIAKVAVMRKDKGN